MKSSWRPSRWCEIVIVMTKIQPGWQKSFKIKDENGTFLQLLHIHLLHQEPSGERHRPQTLLESLATFHNKGISKACLDWTGLIWCMWAGALFLMWPVRTEPIKKKKKKIIENLEMSHPQPTPPFRWRHVLRLQPQMVNCDASWGGWCRPQIPWGLWTGCSFGLPWLIREEKNSSMFTSV